MPELVQGTFRIQLCFILLQVVLYFNGRVAAVADISYSICGEHGSNVVGNNNWCISQESQESQSFVKEFGLEALENKYK